MTTDYLTEDSMVKSDQQFICVSFLSDIEKKSSITGVKIRGAFSTYDNACAHAKKLQSADPYFNVFVGEMGKWLPYDPDPDSETIDKSEYQNDELNNIMKNFVENQEKTKIYHEQRKSEKMRETIVDNLLNKQTLRDETASNLVDARNNNESDKVINLESSMKSIEEQIKEFKIKKDDLEKEIKVYTDQMGQFETKLAPPTIIETDN